MNHLFLVCTGNNLRENSGTFAHSSKLPKKQENEEDPSLILFFTTSFSSVRFRDDRSCDMHKMSCLSQL